ncbi:MAG: LPXTG cell wall anchor domain-containing protein [Actinobacteria bacterium]|nr:LPXTG cell wall anchor domain-containing protein [Actinomycetota bacterium]
MPKTGGASVASLFALGGGALLVGGGLLVRRIIK